MDGGGTEDPRAERPAEFVEALAKGLAILEGFDARHGSMTLSEIARRIGVSPAAARRALITLQSLGYVGQDGKRFHLRPRVLDLGGAFQASARIGELLEPELRALVDRHGDASSVATLDGDDVLYVAHVSVQRARRATATAGARYPAFATSLGRVLLAGMSEDALDRRLAAAPRPALTARTETAEDALRAEIARVRAQGYATTVDQLDYGVTALAVPIRGAEGRTVAALNTSGYTGMVTPETLVAERLTDLREAASRLSETFLRTPALEAALGPR